MAIIKQYHKDTDTTYVYESISYWDEEKKQSRSKRRLLGKLDPVTGEVVPTGRRGRKSKNAEETQEGSETAALNARAEEQIRELTAELSSCRSKLISLEKENRELRDVLMQLEKHAVQCRELCAPFAGEGRQ